ncbi:hypothetical protein TIFTF001_013362 [Ficus carica]|uniref:RRM domain-containing protein n=1 Tax=Ficus carica TaxID=3494 RepID=A0AA88DI90_FICCA|nr:hypothetical protein TIFTF001_013362 [Ficus carica]
METETVKVSNVSLGVTEQDIKEFFSFSGEVSHVDLRRENDKSQLAFVTFKDPKGAETALLLSGATIVDQQVTVAMALDYKLPSAAISTLPSGTEGTAQGGTESAVKRAEDMVSSMLAKGFTLGKDALNKAKSFDEKHQLSSSTTAKVASLDQKIGLSKKISAGTSMVNDKVREMDEKFQVSEKTKSAFSAAEQTVTNAGSAIMKNRYVLTGASWVTGAFCRVTKVAGDVGQKTKEKVSAQQDHQTVVKGGDDVGETDHQAHQS